VCEVCTYVLSAPTSVWKITSRGLAKVQHQQVVAQLDKQDISLHPTASRLCHFVADSRCIYFSV
jgi:hypothetical protein